MVYSRYLNAQSGRERNSQLSKPTTVSTKFIYPKPTLAFIGGGGDDAIMMMGIERRDINPRTTHKNGHCRFSAYSIGISGASAAQKKLFIAAAAATTAGDSDNEGLKSATTFKRNDEALLKKRKRSSSTSNTCSLNLAHVFEVYVR